MIKQAGATGYKTFRDNVTLNLAKLTVVFGRNNSGKSSLVRLPLLNLANLSTRGPFYTLSWQGVNFAHSFSDLCHISLPHPILTYELKSKDESIAVTLLRVSAIDRTDFVMPTEVRSGKKRFLTRLWDVSSNELEELISREIREVHEILDPWHAIAERTLQGSICISSGRPPLNVVYDQRSPLAFSCEEVPYMLRFEPELAASVNEWFIANMHGVGIEVDKAGFAFRLSTQSDLGLVPLSMAGRGIQSSLPIVAMLLKVAEDYARPGVMTIEEPEEHLHPSVHGGLADLCIQAAQKRQIVVETHSENFILRLRRRIAEGLLDRGDLALVYVDSNNVPRDLDVADDGFVENWPAGVFESDIEETQAMIEARMRAMNDQV